MSHDCVGLGNDADDAHAEVRERSTERRHPTARDLGEDLVERRLVARIDGLDQPSTRRLFRSTLTCPRDYARRGDAGVRAK